MFGCIFEHFWIIFLQKVDPTKQLKIDPRPPQNDKKHLKFAEFAHVSVIIIVTLFLETTEYHLKPLIEEYFYSTDLQLPSVGTSITGLNNGEESTDAPTLDANKHSSKNHKSKDFNKIGKKQGEGESFIERGYKGHTIKVQ